MYFPEKYPNNSAGRQPSQSLPQPSIPTSLPTPEGNRSQDIYSIFKATLPSMTPPPSAETHSNSKEMIEHLLSSLLKSTSNPIKILPKLMLDYAKTFVETEVSEINKFALKIANERCSSSTPIHYEGIKIDCKEGDTLFNLYERVARKEDLDTIIQKLKNLVVPLYLYMEDAIEKNEENAFLFQMCLNDTRKQFESFPTDHLLKKQIEEHKERYKKETSQHKSLEMMGEIYEFELNPSPSQRFKKPSQRAYLIPQLDRLIIPSTMTIKPSSEKLIIPATATQSIEPSDSSYIRQSRPSSNPSNIQPATQKPIVSEPILQSFQATDKFSLKPLNLAAQQFNVQLQRHQTFDHTNAQTTTTQKPIEPNPQCLEATDNSSIRPLRPASNHSTQPATQKPIISESSLQSFHSTDNFLRPLGHGTQHFNAQVDRQKSIIEDNSSRLLRSAELPKQKPILPKQKLILPKPTLQSLLTPDNSSGLLRPAAEIPKQIPILPKPTLQGFLAPESSSGSLRPTSEPPKQKPIIFEPTLQSFQPTDNSYARTSRQPSKHFSVQPATQKPIISDATPKSFEASEDSSVRTSRQASKHFDVQPLKQKPIIEPTKPSFQPSANNSLRPPSQASKPPPSKDRQRKQPTRIPPTREVVSSSAIVTQPTIEKDSIFTDQQENFISQEHLVRQYELYQFMNDNFAAVIKAGNEKTSSPESGQQNFVPSEKQFSQSSKSITPPQGELTPVLRGDQENLPPMDYVPLDSPTHFMEYSEFHYSKTIPVKKKKQVKRSSSYIPPLFATSSSNRNYVPSPAICYSPISNTWSPRSPEDVPLRIEKSKNRSWEKDKPESGLAKKPRHDSPSQTPVFTPQTSLIDKNLV